MCSFLTKEVQNSYKKETLFENYKKILTTINPILPHFSNECLELIGHKKEVRWPSYNDKFLEEDMVPVVVQINGKKRGLINLKKNSDEKELLNIINKDEKLFKYIKNEKIKKQIFIKNKIINFII